MFNYEVKFLTCDETLHLKNGDFKSYKYETKKRSDESIYDAGKRSYCERRGGFWRAPRPRQIRQLESKLRDRGVVYCTWTSENLITMVFSSGAIVYLTIKLETLDVTQILFDRYCVGKISNPNVCNVVLCKSHLMYGHTDRTATLVSFGKTASTQPCRIRDRDPHIQSIELGGGARRTERKVTWCENGAGVRVLVWGATAVEPAPWSPALEDLANLHLYQFTGPQVTLLAYHQLENDTLAVEISHKSDNIIHIIEQIASHKNGVTLDWLRYDVPNSEDRVTKLSSLRETVTQASLPAPVRIVRRSPCDGRLIAACIDGSIHVVHGAAGLVHSTSPGFIPTDVRWAGDIILAAEEGGRLQCFDRALSLLNHHTKCLDFASYFRDPKRLQLLASTPIRGGPLVLVSFTGGPLGLLRVMHPRILTSWIRSGRTNNAVSLLRTLDWEEDGTEGLWAVNKIVCDALRSGLLTDAESAAQAALGAYLAPVAPRGAGAERLAPALHDLARKFFHHLLRRGRIEKAMSLAVDLADWDLFADAGWAAARLGLQALADEAASLAAHYADQQETDCSDSCSQCSSSYSETDDETSASSDIVRNKPPPLPRLTHNNTHSHNNTHANSNTLTSHNNTRTSTLGNSHVTNTNTLTIHNNTRTAHNNTHSHHNTLTTHNNTRTQNNTRLTHNNTLTLHSNSLSSHNNKLTSHNNTLSSHNNALSSHNNTLSAHTNKLTSHNNTLTSHNNALSSHNDILSSHNNTLSAHNPTIVHVPITHTEQTFTNSIRPNLHQYLERDNTIWNTLVRDDTHIRSYDIKPILTHTSKWHSVDGLLNYGSKPKHNLLTINEGSSKLPPDERMTPAHFRHLLQTELREDLPNTLYRYQGGHNYMPSANRQAYRDDDRGGRSEKNKVKFSDTVTIAVVPESVASCPSPSRELADSLPLCPPHAYLSAFAPQQPPNPPSDPPHLPAPQQPENAAHKPPKIKVVHFGMV